MIELVLNMLTKFLKMRNGSETSLDETRNVSSAAHTPKELSISTL
jgi:hypothetical protein